jgi:nucleoside-diphosphate-sugar epimerase
MSLAFPEKIAATLRSEGWSVAVTGAGGWMGQALLEMLASAYGEDFSRRVAAFGSNARRQSLRTGREMTVRPLSAMRHLNQGQWLVAHCAYGTRDKVDAQGSEAFIDANQLLTQTVSEALLALHPQAIFFPSSGAVYGADGQLETDRTRNPYGALKAQDEAHFTALAETLGARLCIPRLFNLSGPYINKWNTYALSDFILQVLEGRTPQIQAKGAVWRSYVHVADLLSLSFAWLLDGAKAETLLFDTRGEEVVEMKELARAVEKALLSASASAFREPDASAPESRYVGAAEPMHGLCRRYGVALMPLTAQIKDTAKYISAISGDLLQQTLLY